MVDGDGFVDDDQAELVRLGPVLPGPIQRRRKRRRRERDALHRRHRRRVGRSRRHRAASSEHAETKDKFLRFPAFKNQC